MKKELSLEKIESVVGKMLGKAVKEITEHNDAKISGLTEVMVRRFEEVDERFDDVDIRLDRVENRLDRVVDDIRLISTHVGLDLRRAA